MSTISAVDTMCRSLETPSYLEVKDDGPDETEGQLGVAVDDVLAPDVDQLDLLVAEEAQRRLHVLYRVETHAPSLTWLHT